MNQRIIRKKSRDKIATREGAREKIIPILKKRKSTLIKILNLK